MRNFVIILFIAAGAATGCQKSFLDRLPNDQISESEVFTNIQNAENFVNNIYNSLPHYNSGMAGPLSSATDETMQGVDWSLSTHDGNTFNKGAFTPANFPFMHLWKEYYSRIRAANIFLENFEKIPEDENHPNRKTRLWGEVKVLKAYYYFELFKRWGAIPLIETTINPFDNPDDIFFERKPVAEVVAYIVRELDEAAGLLPANYADRQSDWGRVSSAVAVAIKSRVLLYFASPLFNPDNDIVRWQHAQEASLTALTAANTAGYAMFTGSYADIFIQYQNRESLWSRPLNSRVIEDEANPRGANGYAHSIPLQELVDDYEMQSTGLKPNQTGSGFDPAAPFAGRDPRFYASILYPGSTWKGRALDPLGADAPVIGELATNYWQRKGLIEGANLFNGSGFINRTWIVFRTTELYLNHAEALNEVGGPNAAVYEAINAVRSRVNMPALPAGLTQSEMRERIRNERRIELAFERHRFWDVRRWMIAETVDNGTVRKVVVSPSEDGGAVYRYEAVQTRVFDKSKHYLLPIPQTELDKVRRKNPGFNQNPGW